MKALKDSNIGENVIYNLSKKGYPLTGAPNNGDYMSSEDLIISSLKCKKARITLGLPIILKENIIDYDALKHLAIKEDVVRELGYVLDNTLNLFYKNGDVYPQEEQLKGAIKYLRNHKGSESPRMMIDTNSPGLEKVLIRLQSDSEKKWGVCGRLTEEGFQHTYSTYSK